MTKVIVKDIQGVVYLSESFGNGVLDGGSYAGEGSNSAEHLL